MPHKAQDRHLRHERRNGRNGADADKLVGSSERGKTPCLYRGYAEARDGADENQRDNKPTGPPPRDVLQPPPLAQRQKRKNREVEGAAAVLENLEDRRSHPSGLEDRGTERRHPLNHPPDA